MQSRSEDLHLLCSCLCHSVRSWIPGPQPRYLADLLAGVQHCGHQTEHRLHYRCLEGIVLLDIETKKKRFMLNHFSLLFEQEYS